jgi:hypothetical protein
MPKQEGNAGEPANSDAKACRLDVGNWQVVGGDAAPDGTVVLAVHNFSKEQSKWASALQVWDMNSQKLLRTLPIDAMFLNPKIAISPDHNLLAMTIWLSKTERLSVVDLVNGTVLWHQDSEYPIQSGFSSDSKQLAVVSMVQGAVLHPRLQLINARSGRESAAADVSQEDESISAISFAVDDSMIAVAVSSTAPHDSTAEELRFITTEGLTILQKKLPQQCKAGTIKFANDGGRVITGCMKPAPFASDWAVTDFHIWDFARLMKDLNLHPR